MSSIRADWSIWTWSNGGFWLVCAVCLATLCLARLCVHSEMYMLMTIFLLVIPTIYRVRTPEHVHVVVLGASEAPHIL